MRSVTYFRIYRETLSRFVRHEGTRQAVYKFSAKTINAYNCICLVEKNLTAKGVIFFDSHFMQRANSPLTEQFKIKLFLNNLKVL
jgi:hypothetical protein